MTSWWRHRVQISVEIHLNEQAQERFHLDRKVRRYFNWVNVRWVNKAIKTAMWFHSTWMRCVLKRNRSRCFNAFQYSVCDENKERLDEKTKFRMHLRNRFFLPQFGPGEVALHTNHRARPAKTPKQIQSSESLTKSTFHQLQSTFHQLQPVLMSSLKSCICCKDFRN